MWYNAARLEKPGLKRDGSGEEEGLGERRRKEISVIFLK